ncbi:MAG: thioredoxin [Spirochaetota bacterium]|nr:MAG: thioredoxin [Spirochaetota bacterium]
MAAHIDTSDSNFDKDIIDADKLVIVDMWAEWCGPCKLMEPVLKEFAEEYLEHVKLVKLNIDQNQQTPAKFNVMNIPTLLLFKEGKEIDRIIGAMPKNQLIKQIKKHLE